jgi:long-chain acyl-CoA synthetase
MPIRGPALDRPVELIRLLEIGLRTKPDELALVSFESRWTWQELDAASRRVAGHYLALGLKPGDRVASLLPNRGALIVHYLACIRAGLVATPLNYRYQAPEIDHALEVSGAVAIVAHAERDADLAQSNLAGQLPLGTISFGAEDGRQPSLEGFLRCESAEIVLPTPTPDWPVFIYFTSGSTGKPKGVTHTHKTYGWMVASTVAGLQLTPDDFFLPGSSASHVGASLMSLAGLAAGARVDVARNFDGTELLPLLRTTRPTLLCMLPSALFGLVRDHGAARDDFESIRLCVSGGDKVSAELEREFTELAGFAIEELYGMTEIGLATLNLLEHNRMGSIGALAPGYSASVRDADAQEVAPGEEGQLWIRFEGNTIGYWNRPDATAETIVDGWLNTGDVVTIDAEGYVWFRGRKKQIIVHDGSNICPQEVEESLLEHPAVESAGAIGVHDAVHGENVRVYITWRENLDNRPTVTELIQFSRARVGYKAPDEIIVLEEMPINATGKVDRVSLKRMAEQGAAKIS